MSLLTVSVPVQFQITNLVDWAYNNEDAPALLEDLGTREVVRYLVGVDMNDIMSQGRQEAAQALAEPHPGGGQPARAGRPESSRLTWATCIRR